MFCVSKYNNNTIGPKNIVIGILDDEETKPNLQIFTDVSNTEMCASCAFCVYYNDHQNFNKKVKLQQNTAFQT